MQFLRETTQLIPIILKIRALQLFRIIKQLGFFYTLILIIFCLLTSINIFQRGITFNISLIYAGFTLFILSSIHFSRKDEFLLNSISKYAPFLMLLEYVILSSPIIIFLIIEAKVTGTFILLVGSLLISSINKRNFILQKTNIQKFIFLKPHHFEWISGLRRAYLFLCFLLIIAIFLVFIPFISLFFLWYLSLSIASFYQECEPLEILLLHEGTTKQFLLKKISDHMKNYWMFSLPILGLYYAFHPGHWHILLILLVFINLGLIFTVLNKYASYDPGKFNTGNNILVSLVFGSVLIPFFVPVPIVLIARKYFSASQNLNIYFNQ